MVDNLQHNLKIEKSADTIEYSSNFLTVDLEAEEKLPRQSLNSVEAINLLDEIAKCSMTISEVDSDLNIVGKQVECESEQQTSSVI